MSPEYIILLAIFLIAGILLLLIPYVTYRMAFKRRRQTYDPLYGLDSPAFGEYGGKCRAFIETLLSYEYETVRITSRDGLELAARYYRVKDGAPLEIQCHGYKSHPCRDFSGGAVEAMNSGRNLLLIYQRSHCESEGRTITFGLKESEDLLLWIDYAIARFGKDVKISLVGMSMGAATVLMAAGKPLPDNVKCVIADCPYSTTKEIICHVAQGMGIPARPVYPFIRLGARLFGGFDPEEDSPLSAVKRASLPILIFHGDADTFVPAQMSERIFLACASEDKTRVLFEGAEHGMSYLVDRDKYMAEVDKFYRRTLYKD